MINRSKNQSVIFSQLRNDFLHGKEIISLLHPFKSINQWLYWKIIICLLTSIKINPWKLLSCSRIEIWIETALKSTLKSVPWLITNITNIRHSTEEKTSHYDSRFQHESLSFSIWVVWHMNSLSLNWTNKMVIIGKSNMQIFDGNYN